MQIHLDADSLSLVIRIAFLFQVQDQGTPSQRQIYGLLLGRKGRAENSSHIC